MPCTWGINQTYLQPENAKLEEEMREQMLENKLNFVTSRDPFCFETSVTQSRTSLAISIGKFRHIVTHTELETPNLVGLCWTSLYLER
jgi:hypothetical protein